ncbi:histamine N-methyltransferase-like [Saccoglossus kowalevskii]
MQLLKEGMMFFKIAGGGWEKLGIIIGKYYRDPDYNFIGIHAIKDIFDRRLPNVKYQTKQRELWVDVTDCFNEKSQIGSYMIDFITQIYKFRDNCKPEIQKQILYYMRNECCNSGDTAILLNSDETSLIIFKD